MNTHFLGSHYVLFELPVWASSIMLYALTFGAIHMLRDYFEGLPYQVAYSAQFGDASLVACILIAATILQRGVSLPLAFSSSLFHVLVAIGGISLGFTWWFLGRPGHWGDIYHHLCVAPLIFYLACTLLPVIVLHGTKVERFSVLCFVFVWGALVVFDIAHERMNQRQWLRNHGVTLKSK